jgi:hypothetical protein
MITILDLINAGGPGSGPRPGGGKGDGDSDEAVKSQLQDAGWKHEFAGRLQIGDDEYAPYNLYTDGVLNELRVYRDKSWSYKDYSGKTPVITRGKANQLKTLKPRDD